MKNLPLIFGLNLLVLSFSAPSFAQQCSNDPAKTGEQVNERRDPKELEPVAAESPRPDEKTTGSSAAKSQQAK